MTATQAAVRWLVDVNAVCHLFGAFGDLVPEAERDAVEARLERLGEVARPSPETWDTLATTVRSVQRATEAVAHPLAPLLRHWEHDLMRARDRSAREEGPWPC